MSAETYQITIINHPNANLWPVFVEDLTSGRSDVEWRQARFVNSEVRYQCWFQVEDEEPDMFPYLGRFKLTALRCYLDAATRPYQQRCYKWFSVQIHMLFLHGCRCLLGIDAYQQLFLRTYSPREDLRTVEGFFDFFIDHRGNFFLAPEQLSVVLLTMTQNTTPAAFPPSCMNFLEANNLNGYFKWFSHRLRFVLSTKLALVH